MKRFLLSGNEAIARGAYEADVKVCSAYPGTPSTEIFENRPQYSQALYCEWAPNEKVAAEVAYGASIAAFNSDSSWMNAMLAQTWKNFEILRDFFHENFPSAVVYEPEGTYLAWIDLNGWNLTEDELTAFLVEKALFAVNRGSTFGRQGSGFVRFNLASPEAEVRAGLERLKTAAQAAGLR